jgi:hypothetical protein
MADGYENTCKACEALVPITEEEITAIFGTMTGLRDIKLVSEQLFAERLAICGECPDLVGATTCRYCGCFVKVRAKLAASKCALPYRPKW